MITVYVSGGLGNQMFNYAAGRALALAHRTSLVVDVSLLAAQRDRMPLINRFPIKGTIRDLDVSPKPVLKRVLRRISQDAWSKEIVRGPGRFGYFREFKALGARTILKGHYFSYLFFEDHAHTIRAELAPSREMLNSACQEWCMRLLTKIYRTPCSVGVHVRRTDFLASESSVLALSGIERYYRKSLEWFRHRCVSPRFFVVSDDREWCRKFFADERDVEVIEHEWPSGEAVLGDFLLMSCCRHQITANSTFSWWAAWVNQSPDKMVLTPSRWHNKELVNLDELLPKSWIRVDW